MAPGNNKKRITAEVLDRLISDSDYRVACADFELRTPTGGDGFAGRVTAWPASVKLQEIAVAVKAILAQHGATSLDGAMDERGKILDAWVAVRDYLNGLTIPDSPYGTFRSYARSNWSIPPTAHPAQGIVAARMVRCAVMQVYAPFRAVEVRQAEDSRRLAAQRDREQERLAEIARADKLRKAKEKREQKEASRRGTCGIEFAGSSMRFTCDNETVFMYRQDVRRVFFYVRTARIVIVDAHGTEFIPELTGDVEKAVAEVQDWRWRASEGWENRGKRDSRNEQDEQDEVSYFE
jgi:hypothetical protein